MKNVQTMQIFIEVLRLLELKKQRQKKIQMEFQYFCFLFWLNYYYYYLGMKIIAFGFQIHIKQKKDMRRRGRRWGVLGGGIDLISKVQRWILWYQKDLQNGERQQNEELNAKKGGVGAGWVLVVIAVVVMMVVVVVKEEMCYEEQKMTQGFSGGGHATRNARDQSPMRNCQRNWETERRDNAPSSLILQ